MKELMTKLTANGLRFCYEAGPCGYGIQRQLTSAGHQCAVVATRRTGLTQAADATSTNAL